MKLLHIAVVAFNLSIAMSAFAQDSVGVVAVRDWYSGVSIDGQTDRGASFRAYHSPDGKISAVVDGQYKNSGTWKIVEPGQVCIAWKDTTWGTNPCYTIFKESDQWKIVRVDDSKIEIDV